MKPLRICKSPYYNWIFRTLDGSFLRYGKTADDDPKFSPFGPEILDIEISTKCRAACPWCYKSNTADGSNMSLETYKRVLSTFPNNLMQVAFGIGSIDTNPDLEAIMSHTREQGIVPNITVNGYDIEDSHLKMLSTICGAVAVSAYHNGNACLDTIRRLYATKGSLPSATLQQINIHKLLAQETIDECFQLIERVKKEEVPVNAIVFLLLKPIGKRNKLTSITDFTIYKRLMEAANEAKVGIGMDSCSAPMVLKNMEMSDVNRMSIEPCESGLFSLYVNVDGDVFPCSFCEETFNLGVNLTSVNDFMKEVWFAPKMREWRRGLLMSTARCSCEHKAGCRSCPVFDITACNKWESKP